MFYLYLLSAVVLFAIQWILYGKYAREMDGITTSLLRNGSLILVGLVLVPWIPHDWHVHIAEHRPLILLTAVLGIGHIALNYESYKHLPMGIAALLKKVSAISTWIIVWLVFLWESVSLRHLVLLGVIVTASLLVWYYRDQDTQLSPTSNYRKGITLIVISGVFNTLSWRWYKTYAEAMNPFLATYILEASIGIALLLIVPIYRAYTKTKPTIHKKHIYQISAISLLVIGASACFTLALQTGPFIIANTLLVMTIPLIFIGSYLLYHENINKKQIIPIAISLIALILLKVT